MAITLATGTQVAIASTYGAASNVSAATNAATCVITVAAAHGIVVGDFVEFTSGWDLVTGRVFRVSVVATNDVTLEGLNTTSLSLYPAGVGTGSVRRITAWTPITQIQSVSPSGGDQEYTDITTLLDRIRKQMPTTRTAVEINFVIFDDPALPWYSVVSNASDTAAPTAIRFIMANNSRLVLNGYYGLQKVPNIASNAPLTHGLAFSALSDPTRYAT